MAKRAIRPIRIEGNVAYVPLTKGYEAVIDVTDVPLVNRWNWTAMLSRRNDGSIKTVYAGRGVRSGGKQRLVLMHRVIDATPYGFDTDHRDGDGLNNRRANLRPATKSQNARNQQTSVNNTSGVKGVHLHKPTGRWAARIRAGGKRYDLGAFATLEEAAAAYAEASAKLHGEFGRA